MTDTLQNVFSEECAAGNHHVGSIGLKSIKLNDWEKSISAFESVINDFNLRGTRHAEPHPGFAHRYNFCPYCRAPIDHTMVRDATNWGQTEILITGDRNK